MIKRIITALVLTGFVIVMYSCGQGSPSSAPVGSTITIFPASVSVSDAGGLATHRQDFVIMVKNANGVPLNNVKLNISYSWAVPDPTGYVQLYDGDVAVDSPMEATTDENGTYTLRFDYQSGSIEYTADLVVTSGSSSASAEFAVDAGA